MSSLLRRLADALRPPDDAVMQHVQGRHRMPAHIARAVREGVAVEHGRSAVAAARVEAVEYVATEALCATGRSLSEGFWARHVPHSAARYQTVVDLAAMTLADIVAETGRP